MPSAPKCPAEAATAVSLGELRRHNGLSQITLANRLKVSQPHIAKFENQEDMHFSTLRRYIEALGGELQLVAHFPHGAVEIELEKMRNDLQIQNNNQQ